MKYDLLIIGGGPAGYEGALYAAKNNLKVALIERDKLGGTCLNYGCIPTKALLHSSDIFAQKNDWSQIGIEAKDISFNQENVYLHKCEIVNKLEKGISDLLKNANIDVFYGNGKIVSKNIVECESENRKLEIEAENILIATGSSPMKIPIKGIEYALNSSDVLSTPIEESKIAIIGGGVIGVEFATYFAQIGKQVTIIENMQNILPMFSKEISQKIKISLKKMGVEILTGYFAKEIGEAFVEIEKDNSIKRINCDKVIFAIGRKANIENIGLDNIGIKADKFIQVDENMKTSQSNVYAVGDISGQIQLAHFATASAKVAVDNILNKQSKIDLSVVPSCVYTNPEIAVVGECNKEFNCKKYMFGANGKSLINGQNNGFIKIYYDNELIIKGCEIMSGQATEIVGELALAIKNKLTLTQISSTIHAHPTVYEAIGEACSL